MSARDAWGVVLVATGELLLGMAGAAVWMLLPMGEAQATVINGIYGAEIEYVSGGAIVRDGSGVSFQGRTWDVPSSRTVRATDTGAPLRIGGNNINVNAARTMTPIAIGRASALALKTLPVIGTGIAVWEIWDAVRVNPDGSGELVFDPGTAPVSSTVTLWNATVGGTTCSGKVSSQAAFDCAVAARYPGNVVISGSPARHRTETGTPGSCVDKPTTGTHSCNYSVLRVDTYPDMPAWNTTTNFPTNSGSVGAQAPSTVTECPASIDASNPAYSLPAGLPVGPDGKCRTARYNHTPIAPNAAADLLEATAPPTGEQLKDMAQDAIARGQSIEASERQLSGPTSVPGTPTTTTTNNPGGTTTTTTKTPTTNYTYNNNTVNYTTTTVTVTNNAGDVTTTTEGTTPQESEACKTAPDSLGCSKMGTPGTEAPAWQTRDVVFAPEDLGFEGSCPAPESWAVFGMTLTWGYEPVCDVAPFIRFALLAFAGIGAISIVIRETNS